MLTVYLEAADVEDALASSAAVEARLRAELARHLPRRHTPIVKLSFLPLSEEGGEA